MVNAQQWLDQKYPNKEEVVKIISYESEEDFEKGTLEIKELDNLKTIKIKVEERRREEEEAQETQGEKKLSRRKRRLLQTSEQREKVDNEFANEMLAGLRKERERVEEVGPENFNPKLMQGLGIDIEKIPEQIMYQNELLLESGNQDKSLLNISNCPSLTEIEINKNPSEDSSLRMRVENCPQLTKIKCPGIGLVSLIIKNCPKLTKIYCGNNNLKKFSISRVFSR